MTQNSLLQPEITERIKRLELAARRIVEGMMSGSHRSPYFGQSIEFRQHRPYVEGDELRHVDWKVYARQDRLTVKQYEEETNLRLQLLVDTSESMAYGAGSRESSKTDPRFGDGSKWDTAATIAASLAYLAIRQKDAAGILTFDDVVRQSIPAAGGDAQLRRILSTLGSTTAAGRTDLVKVATQATAAIPRAGLVCVVSDLLGVDSVVDGLKVLRSRGHDVSLFHVLHDDELDFTMSGATKFQGLEGAGVLHCNPASLRDGYLKALEEFLDKTRRSCARLRVDYTLVRTSDRLDAVLAKYLVNRKRR